MLNTETRPLYFKTFEHQVCKHSNYLESLDILNTVAESLNDFFLEKVSVIIVFSVVKKISAWAEIAKIIQSSLPQNLVPESLGKVLDSIIHFRKKHTFYLTIDLKKWSWNPSTFRDEDSSQSLNNNLDMCSIYLGSLFLTDMVHFNLHLMEMKGKTNTELLWCLS